MKNIALVLLVVDGKLLMFRREKNDKDPHGGMFGLIGGHVRESESSLEGLKREAREEAGLNLPNPKYISTYKFGNDKINLFAQELKDTNGIKLNHEHTEYKLFDPSELKKPDIIDTTKFMYNDYLHKK